jgi:lipopolysaccharide/colanic/teichoic acid biosynthesis glycosyltransferase
VSPLLLLAAVAIKWNSPGPVLFHQRRTGLGGRPFTMYKLRTMYIDAESRKESLRHLSEQDGPAFKMKDDPRITTVGKYLRKTCIDELPQLWNVFIGDMTLVGPRPLPCNEAEGCKNWERRRLDVTPGLTCIWQVRSGRSRIAFADWMRMDLQYIRRRSPLEDLRLLWKTLVAVILHRASH